MMNKINNNNINNVNKQLELKQQKQQPVKKLINEKQNHYWINK